MKRFSIFLLLLICISGLIGCSNKSSVTKELIKFDEISMFILENESSELINNLKGFYREDIIRSWGEPDSVALDLFEDCWFLDIDNNEFIVVYYDDNNCVINAVITVSDAKTELQDLIPMIMINDTIYLDTGLESTMGGRCGVLDGEIISQVASNEKPTINDQSNFGTGFGYQYGEKEGTVEVYINDKWWVFVKE